MSLNGKYFSKKIQILSFQLIFRINCWFMNEWFYIFNLYLYRNDEVAHVWLPWNKFKLSLIHNLFNCLSLIYHENMCDELWFMKVIIINIIIVLLSFLASNIFILCNRLNNFINVLQIHVMTYKYNSRFILLCIKFYLEFS